MLGTSSWWTSSGFRSLIDALESSTVMVGLYFNGDNYFKSLVRT